MKKITATLVATLSATASFAGSLAYVAPEVTMLEEPASMGGSGSWLIPLILIAILGFVISNNCDPKKDKGCKKPR